MFAALFSLFLLTLTLVPCTDAVEGAHEHTAQTHQHAHSAPIHEHEGEADDCSPLCQCQCCHVNVTLTSTFRIPSLLTSTYRPVIQYAETVVEVYVPTQFKPPIA